MIYVLYIKKDAVARLGNSTFLRLYRKALNVLLHKVGKINSKISYQKVLS